MMYSDKVMDHFRNPRNMGEITEPSGVGEVGNPTCGDVMKLWVKIEGDRIVDAKFKTFGCGAAIATSSMVTELVIGKSIDEALEISNQQVAEALDGLPPVKMHCSVLAEEALCGALIDYYEKNGQQLPENLIRMKKKIEKDSEVADEKHDEISH
ncbi:MAG: Fe-S cluster assembly scaffold protein NifU [bacterium]